ncbi:chromosome segregation protein SMC [Staphylospora marina]|uniref:chromosome segregation protein SMC n=1 Tax=Staphylospora marina TaxID=2490858 RepID=UPI000F5BECC4|nr:chromosome segregation protein SMC [Staphylospora marina]
MYLKRLEMQGFKSFADRTELEFVPGITAVVGPNGSGKSNVTDGIRWVLGEQSAKSLRGNKMEDVIFAGSDTRKPVGFCEVSMTFDNTERRLPLDFAEVTVTRRVYRSGESEYFLNKQPCRLKDIHELFMDTGIGKDAYSMIGQGRIDEILSSKSEDRRAIFEEAAGIVKYKSRKKEAEKKLDNTEQNLSRIHDLIHELEGQEEPLREQAEKARKYKELKEQLKQVEVGLYVHKIRTVHQGWQDTVQEVKRLKEEQVTLAAEISTREAALEELKAELHRQEKVWEEIQGELLSVSEELEKAEGQREVWLERLTNRDRSKEQIQRRIAELKEQQDRLVREERELVERLEQKRTELDAAMEDLRRIEEQLSDLAADGEISLAESMDKLQKLGNRMASLESERQYLAAQLEELTRKLESFAEREARIAEERVPLEEEQQTIAGALSDIEQAKLEATEKLRALAAQKSALEEEEKETSGRLRKEEQWLHRLRSQWELLREMEADHQGFLQGVREILKARDRGQSSLAGIHGAVAQLIQVPAEYEAAMETALGGAMQHLVAENEATARSGIAYLKEKRLGRATFLPLDVIRPRSLPEHELRRAGGIDGFVGVASDLVKTELRYRHLAQHLLGMVLVTRTLEQANRMARELGYRYRIVTLDGDVVNPGGSMTGGSRQSNRTQLLGRTRQLEELEAKIREAEASVSGTEQTLRELKSRRTDLERRWEALRNQGEERRAREQELLGAKRETSMRLEALRTEAERLIREREETAGSREAIQHRLSGLDRDLERLGEEKAVAEEAVRRARETERRHSTEREEATHRYTDCKVKVSGLGQEVAHLEENLRRIGRELERLDRQWREASRELEQLEHIRETGETEISGLDDRVRQLRESKEKVQESLAETRNRRESLSAERELREKEIRSLQSKYRKQEALLHERDVKSGRLDVELNHLLQKLAEEYETSFERAEREYGVPEDPAAAEKQVRSLKSRITSLGEVNLGAIEEHARISERLEFLKTQEADLLEAKQKLYEIISQLEEEMGRRFLEAFELIRTEFQHVFVQMFGGGRADLQLTDPDNLLETGLEIVAQPPGKKLQNLNLLSGGERALAALALLFAVLCIKPVPFCVLDEVDAALDEANLTRFTRYMKQFKNKTQFIVITHRKHTMEGADVLYGITMQESGVSKLVSVKLEEYDGVREAAATKEQGVG